MRRIDLEGRRFGKLVVLHRSVRNPYRYWECHCDCGRHTVARSDNLKSGHVKSCGCFSVREGPGYIWSEQDKQTLRELWGVVTRRGIAAAIGRSPRAVTAMASRLQLKKPAPPAIVTPSPGRSIIPPPSEEEYSAVIRECAVWHGVPPHKAFSATRSRTIVVVRWDAWARLKERRYTYQGIGLVSGYDHTSVLHGLRRRLELHQSQPELEAAE